MSSIMSPINSLLTPMLAPINQRLAPIMAAMERSGTISGTINGTRRNNKMLSGNKAYVLS